MDNRFDKISKELKESDLRYRIRNPEKFQPKAVESAENELKSRGLSLDVDITQEIEHNENSRNKTKRKIATDEQSIADYENQLKGKMVGFGQRLGAHLIDIVLTNVIFTLLFTVTNANLPYGIILLLSVLYDIVWEVSEYQATPGKLLLKLKVVNEHGGRISIKTALSRQFGKFLSGIFLGVGYLQIIFNDKKQSLHDQISHSYIIKRKEEFSNSTKDDLLDEKLDIG